jgi:hypothetical protein
MEMALGTDPSVAGHAPQVLASAPYLVGSSRMITLSYDRFINAATWATLELQCSPDLQTWSPVPTAPVVTRPSGLQRDRVTYDVPVTPGYRYYRLHMTKR